jgi:5-formyltetrahydrofolate cyclo-ligase
VAVPTPPKPQLRERLLEARGERGVEEIEAARAAIRRLLVGRSADEGWRTVAAYVPLRTEPGSVELLDELTGSGVRVLVPVLLPDLDLDWTPWGSAEPLGPGAIGRCDAVLAPALAVAPGGARLGRGGGSYDRALARRRRDALVLALVYAEEVLDELPAEAWDEPVDEAVTPAGFVRLR